MTREWCCEYVFGNFEFGNIRMVGLRDEAGQGMTLWFVVKDLSAVFGRKALGRMLYRNVLSENIIKWKIDDGRKGTGGVHHMLMVNEKGLNGWLLKSGIASALRFKTFVSQWISGLVKERQMQCDLIREVAILRQDHLLLTRRISHLTGKKWL
ncbi:MAG: hypothetical protein RR310_09135 [Eubacterium sp.]